ncbi:MAG: hypothetical protein JW834_03530 [Candidatus Diapherotrites archaeon]|nr:hypothetical protein [Candidatus Diapherotrites archaeon]
MEKLSANPAIVQNLGVPPEMAAIGMAIKSARAFGYSSGGPSAFIVEGVMDMGQLMPIITQRISQASGEDITTTTQQYGDYTVYTMNGAYYFTDMNKVYLGEEGAIKKIIDVKTGTANATIAYADILGMLPDGDVLVASTSQDGGGDNPEKMGISAIVNGNLADVYIIAKFESAEKALEQSEEARKEVGGEGVSVESVDVQGQYVVVKMKMDLTKNSPFGQVGSATMVNPEKEGWDIRACMETARYRCENLQWECEDKAWEACLDVEWGCSDNMRECFPQEEFEQRRMECTQQDTYNERMKACWGNVGAQDFWTECYDDNYFQEKRNACWQGGDSTACETLCTTTCNTQDCNAIYDEYSKLADEACSQIQRQYLADADAQCQTLTENSTTTCDQLKADADSRASADCQAKRDEYNRMAEEQCRNQQQTSDEDCRTQQEECNRKKEECNNNQYQNNDECARGVDREAEQKKEECNQQFRQQEEDARECERVIEKERNELVTKCDRELQYEFEKQRRECERSTSRECEEKMASCKNSVLEDCFKQVDECYKENERECMEESGVSEFVPRESTRTGARVIQAQPVIKQERIMPTQPLYEEPKQVEPEEPSVGGGVGVCMPPDCTDTTA